MAALLNPKHEQFCQLILAGAKVKDAYEAVGYSIKSSVSAANKLAKHRQVVERIAELHELLVKKTFEGVIVNRQYVVTKLQIIAERCMQEVSPVPGQDKFFTFNASAATKALELLGKEVGMFVERKEIGKPGDFADLSDADLERAYEESSRAIVEAQKIRKANELEGDYERVGEEETGTAALEVSQDSGSGEDRATD